MLGIEDRMLVCTVLCTFYTYYMTTQCRYYKYSNVLGKNGNATFMSRFITFCLATYCTNN